MLEWFPHSDETSDSDCDSVALNENDSEDLRFTQYGTHDENQDDGEANSQERSLVQDKPFPICFQLRKMVVIFTVLSS